MKLVRVKISGTLHSLHYVLTFFSVSFKWPKRWSTEGASLQNGASASPSYLWSSLFG